MEFTSSDASNIIAEQTIFIKKLEQQNAELRAQWNVGNSLIPAPSPLGAEAWEHSPEDFGILAHEHALNLSRLRNVQAELRNCERTTRRALDKAHSYKDGVKQWKVYFENRRPQASRPATMSRSPGILSSPPRPSTHRVTSSQSTVAEEPQANEDCRDRVTRKAALPSSDSEPIVVSARSLKRMAGTTTGEERPASRLKRESNSPENPIELKSGEYSSPVLPAQNLNRTDTSDLDAIEGAMVTPRRPKRTRVMDDRAISEQPTRAAPQLVRHGSSVSDGHIPMDVSIDIPMDLPEVFARSNTKPSTAGDGRVDAVALRPIIPPRTERSRQSINALQPISVNTPRNVSSHYAKVKPRARRPGAKGDVAILSEDGDMMSSQASLPETNRGKTPQTSIPGRLDALLSEPTSETAPLLPPEIMKAAVARKKTAEHRQIRTPVSVLRDRPQEEGASTVKRAQDPQRFSLAVRPHDTPQSVARTSASRSPQKRTPVSLVKKSPQVNRQNILQRPPGLERSPPPVKPEDEPLRLRPLASLRAEDFKVNPKYLGTDFAFADSIRGRDARRNLHICKQPDCCGGAFAKAVEIGGSKLSGKTDIQALEAYFGADWADQIRAHGPEQRKAIVTQAHVELVSGEHGKHRRAFDRQTTPPGFWRTSMPNTQEEMEDRKKSLEIQKAKVAERWREAMREGGRWLFRDE